MKGKRFLITALVLILASVCLWGGGKKELMKVDFQLNWKIVGDHAPYFVALKNGWFEEEGLDVNIIIGQGSGYTVQVVDAGKAHLGVADTPVVVKARAAGAKVKMIAMVFDKHPDCMFFWKDSGITKPQDIVGKTVAVPAADGHRIMWPAFAGQIGVDPDSVKFVNIDAASKVVSLAAKKADVVFELYTGKPFMEKAIPPEKLGHFIWADYGFKVYAHGLVTSDKVIEENPEMLRKFLKAAYRGWDFTLKDPEAAIAIMAEYHPINKDDYVANLKMGMEFFKTDNYKNKGVGYIDPEKMKATIDVVGKYMGVDINFKPEDVFTGEFLPDPPYKYNW